MTILFVAHGLEQPAISLAQHGNQNQENKFENLP
jgi:hypothetical protein